MIFILTGNGKGKTTGAIGMGIRAAGAGRKVLMVQFLKISGSSEEVAIAKIKNFQVKSFGRPYFILSAKELNILRKSQERAKLVKRAKLVSREDRELAMKGFEAAKKALAGGQCDFLILDEIALAMKYCLLKKNEVIKFLKEYGCIYDIVLTGRYCPKEIIAIADLVSEIKEIRHPYNKGVLAKRGVDY